MTYSSDILLKAKLLTRTSKSVLPIGSAAEMTLQLSSRAWKPYPPGNVKLNSLDLASWPSTTVGNAVLTWNHRNRVSQGVGVSLVAQDFAGTYSPEGFVRVEISVGGVLKRTYETTETAIPSAPPGVGNVNGLAMKNTNTWIIPTSSNQTTAPSRLISVTSSGIANYAGSATDIGQTDGGSSVARFQGSSRSVIDASGSVFTIDKASIIRKTDSSQNTTTVVDLSFYGTITSLAVDGSGNLFAFSDTNREIVKITPALVVSVLAGNRNAFSGTRSDGTGTAASFSPGCQIACDSSGNIFVQEYYSTSGQLGSLRYCTSAGVVTTIANNTGEYFGQLAVIGSDLYIAAFFDHFGSSHYGIRKFTPAGAMTEILSYNYATFGTIQHLAPDPGGFLAFSGITTGGALMIGKVTAGGAASVVYYWPGGGWYGAAERVSDDSDGTKAVSIKITPVNGAYTGQARTLPSFTMTGFGMQFGQNFGGIQA